MSVLLADETGFHPALEAVFDFKYPTTLFDTTSPYLRKYRPLEFHDRHLDPFLSIKCVKPLGFSVCEYLSEFCDNEIKDYVRNEQPLRTGIFFRPRPPVPRTLTNAYEVGRYYFGHIANITARFPSQLYLRPSDERWNSLFFVAPPADPGERDEIFRKPTALYVCTENEMRRFRPPPNDGLISKMKRLGDKYPQLAIYEFYNFSEASRRLLEEMGQQEGFEWTTPETGGYSMDISPRELPRDATGGIWSKISSISQSAKREERRPKGKQGKPSTTSSTNVNPTKSTKSRSRTAKTVEAAVRKGTRGKPYRPAAQDFLQHAWSRAVDVDATFIIFHCGKAERIGLRHRESQTLYLSELIDPSVVEKYGKVQIGLQLAIVKDVFERDAGLSPTKKRPAEPTTAGHPSKRQKKSHLTEDIDSNPSPELLSMSLGSRNLALLCLDHGIYRSPVPSSFFRVESSWDPVLRTEENREPRRKARYSSLEYFSVTLGNRLGSGSVGFVYRATAKFRLGSKTFVHSRLAVKLAVYEPQQASLRHEYAMYKLLASRGATRNILPVYGMFQDAETGILGLVMEYGGDSLASRQAEEGDEPPFTKQEKTTITDAFRCLHDAGVLHGDIRRHNLLLDSSDTLYIIDFDQAVVDPGEEEMKKEVYELMAFLDVGDDDEVEGV